MKKELPLSLKLIRGAIGKEFVIKHYKDGAVKTKYPDMSAIVATVHQRKCRNLFKEAVAYAKAIIADKDMKTCWQQKLRKRNAVYNAAIKEYMLSAKKEKQKEFIEANRLLINALKIAGNAQVVNIKQIIHSKKIQVLKQYLEVNKLSLCSLRQIKNIRHSQHKLQT